MYTIGSFLREEELTGLKLMTDTADLQAEITNINIIDNPDSYDWLSSGDFQRQMAAQIIQIPVRSGGDAQLCPAVPADNIHR